MGLRTSKPRAAAPYEDMIYAYTGEVVDNQMPQTLLVDDTTFHRVNQGVSFRIMEPPATVAAIAASPDLQWHGPHVAGVGVEEVVLRFSSYIPQVLIPMLFDHQTTLLTPKQVFELVYPFLVAAGVDDQCTYFLRFVIAAMTDINTTALLPARSAVVRDALAPATMVPGLTASRLNLCHIQLPAMANVTVQPEMQQMTNILAAMLDQNVATAQADALRRDTVVERDVETFYVGCFQQSVERDQLPPVYQAMATAGKKGARAVIEGHVNAAMVLLGYPPNYVATPAITIKVLNGDHYNLQIATKPEGGLSVLHFGLPSAIEGSREDVEQAQLYDVALVAGNVSIADLSQLTLSGGIRSPRKNTDWKRMQQVYHGFCYAIYGTNHPITNAARDYLIRGMENENHLEIHESFFPRHKDLTYLYSSCVCIRPGCQQLVGIPTVADASRCCYEPTTSGCLGFHRDDESNLGTSSS
jgi:hypothetical protein